MKIYLWIMVILHVFLLGIVAEAHGKEKKGSYNFWSSLIGAMIGAPLIYMSYLYLYQ